MTFQQVRENGAMKYWSLAPGSSDAQKKKLKQKIEGNEYFLLKKRDGVWYKYSHSTKDDAILQSRTISTSTGELVEKQANVPHIMEALKVLPENTILLGEICYKRTGSLSSDITKIMGCLAEKAIARQDKDKLHYYIFDVLYFDGMEIGNQPAEKRIKVVEHIQNNYSFPDFIEFTEPIYEDIPQTVAEWIAQGEEGGVLMNKKKPYLYERTKSAEAWATIKVKQSLTEGIDLVVMGFTPSEKNYTGKYKEAWTLWENAKTGELVEGYLHGEPGFEAVTQGYFNKLTGSLVLGAYYGDKLIQVCKVSNLTDELRRDVTDNPDKFLGMVVEVSAMLADVEKKTLRHPKLIRLREDKKPSECLYSDVF